MPVPWELADMAGRATSRSGLQAPAGARHGPEQVLTALAPWGCGDLIGRGELPDDGAHGPYGRRGLPGFTGRHREDPAHKQEFGAGSGDSHAAIG
jgi:hypothetical protein